ncbi:MAG: DUF411 domain-containing protein [Chloroflexi bacterium]|nr:DUF411 domain-containing protein [Chloroflexota bacterium]
MQDIETVSERRMVPETIRSCHTAVVSGYLVEGHVPAAVVQRLLRDRPDVVGIGVPGMPAGSPGMESPHPVSYEVLAWRSSGAPFVFARVAADGGITY